MKEIAVAKFDRPSPIQAISLPVVLSGNDLIGIAETGSGKTVSFLLPAIVHINAQLRVSPGEGPVALILAPTRELAMQIEKECIRFGGSSRMRCACIYGGADKFPQRNKLTSGVELIVATPGRLIDFLESGHTNLRRVTYMVLDEADRMLDMGFEQQLRKILGQIRSDRQTLMFSATWPKAIQALARDYIKNEPVQIQIGSHELSINDRITQIVYVCDGRQKMSLMLKQLGQLSHQNKVMVFSQTKRSCEEISWNLNSCGFNSLAIHGDKSQTEREAIMERFKNGESKVLIATDVASRGIDVKDVTHVINFDFPKALEDYVHRIGRTGRAGARGVAVSFLNPDNDRKIAREFVQMLHDAKQEMPNDLLDLAYIGFGERSKYKPISASYYNIQCSGGSSQNGGGAQSSQNNRGKSAAVIAQEEQERERERRRELEREQEMEKERQLERERERERSEEKKQAQRYANSQWHQAGASSRVNTSESNAWSASIPSGW